MLRSFTDRVFGGVCGGLAAVLHINSWVVRLVFAVLTLLSLGAFAVVYVLLWWLAPQESLAGRRTRPLSLGVVILLIALAAAGWYARDAGLLRAPTGADLFWPGAAALLAIVFALRQVGGARV